MNVPSTLLSRQLKSTHMVKDEGMKYNASSPDSPRNARLRSLLLFHGFHSDLREHHHFIRACLPRSAGYILSCLPCGSELDFAHTGERFFGWGRKEVTPTTRAAPMIVRVCPDK